MIDDPDNSGNSKDIRREAIERIETLPSIPAVLSQILACVDDPDTTASDLSDIVLQEQAIALKILRLANSPIYGQTRQIDDITTAVVVVGFQEVSQAAVSCSVMNVLSKDVPPGAFDVIDFWKYSLACAITARKVAELSQYGFKQQAYLYGLLHDIGKLVILYLFPEEYNKVVSDTQSEGDVLHVREHTAFGFNHCEAGMWLAEKWSLPTRVTRVIGYHHSLDNLPEGSVREIFLCHAAEYITRSVGLGSNGDVVYPLLHEDAAAALGIQATSIENVILTAAMWSEQVEATTNAIMRNG